MGAVMAALTGNDVIKRIKNENIKFIDLRFTDTKGRDMHMSVNAKSVDESFFTDGKMFDGSSILGWQDISQSDLILKPLAETTVLDPFFNDPTLLVRCDIVDPRTGDAYGRAPRTVAKKATRYLQETGIADTCIIGNEPEFFVFDDVGYACEMQGAFYRIDSEEAHWNSGKAYPGGNFGHRPRPKGGYSPAPPVDSAQDLRSAIANHCEAMGLIVEVHHHEVATSNQNEVSIQYNDLLTKSDETLLLKYIVQNTAQTFGQTATFMPKPLVGDNGSGMHCHISLQKEGQNLFDGNGYANLSETAILFIGGIMHHARALNAFTNRTTNSYKRLVPGFEAPIHLAYSACNRSAAIRIPFATHAKGRRIEVRFPDPLANPYLAHSALLMAGIDGIQRRLHPGEAIDKNLYTADATSLKNVKQVCFSLEEALKSLEMDHEFLLAGDVFTRDMLNSYIGLLEEDVLRYRAVTHPVEFDMYYSD